MGASNDSKPAAGSEASINVQHLPVTNRLRSGSVHLPVNPGVLRRHHLLLSIVTLALTLALLVQALTPHRCGQCTHHCTTEHEPSITDPSCWPRHYPDVAPLSHTAHTPRPAHMPSIPACTPLVNCSLLE